MGVVALIGLGSNLGDRKAALDEAVAALSATPGIEVQAVSSYHETPPIGGPGGQGVFLNAAARLSATVGPLALLGAIREIEARSGRVRGERWEARTLDLDLLLYGDRVVEMPELILPHPRMSVRRFVLAPLAEVAGHVLDPLTNRGIPWLLDNLDRRPSYVAIDGLAGPFRSSLFDRLVSSLDAVPIRWADATSSRGQRGDRAGDLDRLEANAQALHANRWPARDRWIASDFCLDLELRRFQRTRPLPTTLEGHARESRASSVAKSALAPTFAVVLGGDAGPRRGPFLTRYPLLWIASEDPEEVAAEVLAACAASRAGAAGT